MTSFIQIFFWGAGLKILSSRINDKNGRIEPDFSVYIFVFFSYYRVTSICHSLQFTQHLGSKSSISMCATASCVYRMYASMNCTTFNSIYNKLDIPVQWHLLEVFPLSVAPFRRMWIRVVLIVVVAVGSSSSASSSFHCLWWLMLLM